jgi:type 1 glutamine amidotransferase
LPWLRRSAQINLSTEQSIRMKIARIPLLAIIYAALTLGSATAADPKPSKPLKALFFAGGCCHDYEKLVPHLTNSLRQEINVSFEVKWNMDPWKDAHFADGYDLIVYDVCFEEVETTSLEHALKTAHEGKPTVMLHCAVHAFRKSEKIRDWENLCGMRSKVHDPYQVFSTVKLDAKHPVTKNFPADWKTPGDELYQTIELIEGSTPLLKAKSPQDGREHTVCWVQKYGRGRVFATTLGHDMKTAETTDYIRLVADGIRWTTKASNTGK